MGSKKISSFESLGSMVFSTNRDLDLSPAPAEETPALPPEKQRLVVRRDTSGRKGKVVTLVQGFEGPAEALEELAKELKKHCGAGGSAKDGEAVIQGDVREKTGKFLSDRGYRVRVI